jgi:ribosomal protein L24
MIKNIPALEVSVADRVYKMLLAPDSTWGEVHDVLHKMKDYVVAQINALQEKEKQQKAESDPVACPDCEVLE